MKKYIALALLCTITAYAAACTDTLTALPAATFATGVAIDNISATQINQNYYIALADNNIEIIQFNPISQSLSPLPSATSSAGDIDVAWQQIGLSSYLAVSGGTSPHVSVLQFNPALGLLSSLLSATFNNGTLVYNLDWQAIGGSYYLAAGGGNLPSGPEVSILAFNPALGLLSSLPSATFNNGAAVFNLAWQAIADSYYLAVASNVSGGPTVRVLQFNPTSGILSSLPSATIFSSGFVGALGWQEINSSFYLAIGGGANAEGAQLQILEFNPTSGLLSRALTSTASVGGSIVNLAWQEINSSFYLALAIASGTEVQIALFDPSSNSITLLSTATSDFGGQASSPAWQQIDSDYYLFIGGTPSPQLRAFQFNACTNPTPTPTPSSETNDFTQALIAKYSARVLAAQATS